MIFNRLAVISGRRLVDPLDRPAEAALRGKKRRIGPAQRARGEPRRAGLGDGHRHGLPGREVGARRAVVARAAVDNEYLVTESGHSRRVPCAHLLLPRLIDWGRRHSFHRTGRG